MALAFRPLTRGAEYTVWGYTPQPSPSRLAKSPATYPPEIALDGQYLRLPHSVAVPTVRLARLRGVGARVLRRPTSRGALPPALRRGDPNRRTGDEPVRGCGRARGVVPLGRRVRLRRAAAACGRGRAARPLRDEVEARLLPALLRSDGADAPLPRDSRAGGRRLLERRLRRGAEAVDGLRPRCPHVGRGVVQRLRLAPIRSHAGAGHPRRARTRPLRRGSTRPGRPEFSTSAILGDGAEARQLLRFELGTLGREALTPNTDPSEAAQGGSSASQDEQRGPGLALFLVLGALGAALLFVLAKLALRRSRYLTRDPRRIAAACRRELVDFLRDQRIDVPPSAGTNELGEFLGRRAGVDATELADALGRARYGPLPRAEEAAREARHETRSVRRGLRRALPPGRRFRGLFSLRSLFAAN